MANEPGLGEEGQARIGEGREFDDHRPIFRPLRAKFHKGNDDAKAIGMVQHRDDGQIAGDKDNGDIDIITNVRVLNCEHRGCENEGAQQQAAKEAQSDGHYRAGKAPAEGLFHGDQGHGDGKANHA